MTVGKTYELTGVAFHPTKYGDVAVFETPEGRVYSGAMALVDDARLMEETDFPMTVTVTEMESSVGRKYQTFE